MSNTKALAVLSKSLDNSSEYISPFFDYRGVDNPSVSNIHSYLSRFQFERVSFDLGMWRDVIREMELAFYPSRVGAQRMYMDTVENPEVKSVIDRWLELITQRDYEIYQFKEGKKIVSKDLSQQISSQYWFADYLEEVALADAYGYSYISLGDVVGDSFPYLSTVQREHIIPDGGGRNTPLLTSMVYSRSGLNVNDKIISLCNHFIPTKNRRGVNSCGYGWLYNVALIEIHLRHIMEWNMDFTENFGMPIKVGKTSKTGQARANFEAFLASGASNQWALLDKNQDDIAYTMAAHAGTAWKTYDNMEYRLKSLLARLILGHDDAMTSTPGKLGGNQSSNKEGDNISLVQQAVNSKQISIGNFCIRRVNENTPKFRELGRLIESKVIKGLFPEGYTFGLKNDAEEEEIKRRLNKNRTAISVWVGNLNNGGWDVKAEQLTELLEGIDVKAGIPQHELIEQRKSDTTIHKDEPSTPPPTKK